MTEFTTTLLLVASASFVAGICVGWYLATRQ